MALKKAARRLNDEGGLGITSMMDMMTIILVFLLKSYGTDDISVGASADLELPSSTTRKKPELSVNVVVSKSKIVVDGAEVLNLTMASDEESGEQLLAIPEDEKRGQLISKLYDRLLEKAEDSKQMAEMTSKDEHEFKGRLLLQCDKTLPFLVIREVMYTAGQAQFSEFKFVVYMGT